MVAAVEPLPCTARDFTDRSTADCTYSSGLARHAAHDKCASCRWRALLPPPPPFRLCRISAVRVEAATRVMAAESSITCTDRSALLRTAGRQCCEPPTGLLPPGRGDHSRELVPASQLRRSAQGQGGNIMHGAIPWQQHLCVDVLVGPVDGEAWPLWSALHLHSAHGESAAEASHAR